MPRSKDEAKERARLYYFNPLENLTIKEIAKRVGVRANTVGDWIKKEGWDKLKKSILVTKNKTISDLYDQLELLTDEIKTRKIVRDIPENLLKPIKLKDKDGNEKLEYPEYTPEDYPIKIGNYATSKEANQIIALTNSIKKLETETSIAEIVEVSRDFLEWLKLQDFDLQKTILPFFDEFINSKI